MRLGIIGTGTMGGALGPLWARRGHEVFFGSRDAEKAKRAAAKINSHSRGGTYAEAAAFAEVVVLTVQWQGLESAINEFGSLDEKVVLDVTNPDAADFRSPVIGHTTSGAETVARWTASGRVVKSLNHVYGSALLRGPAFDGQRLTSFYCGDDAASKTIVARLLEDLGCDPIDAGPLQNARFLEPMAYLMVYLAREQGFGGENIALKLLRRADEANR